MIVRRDISAGKAKMETSIRLTFLALPASAVGAENVGQLVIEFHHRLVVEELLLALVLSVLVIVSVVVVERGQTTRFERLEELLSEFFVDLLVVRVVRILVVVLVLLRVFSCRSVHLGGSDLVARVHVSLVSIGFTVLFRVRLVRHRGNRLQQESDGLLTHLAREAFDRLGRDRLDKRRRSLEEREQERDEDRRRFGKFRFRIVVVHRGRLVVGFVRCEEGREQERERVAQLLSRESYNTEQSVSVGSTCTSKENGSDLTSRTSIASPCSSHSINETPSTRLLACLRLCSSSSFALSFLPTGFASNSYMSRTRVLRSVSSSSSSSLSSSSAFGETAAIEKCFESLPRFSSVANARASHTEPVTRDLSPAAAGVAVRSAVKTEKNRDFAACRCAVESCGSAT